MAPQKPDKRAAKRNAAIAATLAIATLLTFWPALNYGFLTYDDPAYVFENPRVNKGLTAEAIRHAFTGTFVGNWHPLTSLSHILDVQFYGLGPTGHHFTSILIHAINAALLFLMLDRMTGRTGPSIAVALFFAIHPLRVESVVWISERKDVLSTFFWFLGILLYARYCEKPSTRRYVAVCAAFVCGLLSKSMLVTFPFLLMLLDVWPLKRTDFSRPRARLIQDFQKLFAEKIPMFAITVLFSIVAVLTQRAGKAIGSSDDFPLVNRLLNALDAYGQYIVKTLYPSKLAMMYPFKPFLADALPGALAGLAIVSVCVAAAWRFRITAPYVFTGVFWYLGTLVPVIGIVKIGLQGMADRYTYVPAVGFVIVLVWSIADIAAKRRLPKWVLPAATAVTVCVLFAGTRHYASFWQDSERLYRRTLAVTEDNYTVIINLSNLLIHRGEPEDNAEAEKILTDAINTFPRASEACKNLGILRTLQARHGEALELFTRGLETNPNDVNLYYLRASALLQLGRAKEAADALRDGLVRFPRDPNLRSLWQQMNTPARPPR